MKVRDVLQIASDRAVCTVAKTSCEDEHAKAIVSVHVDDALSVGVSDGLDTIRTSMSSVFTLKTTKNPTLVIGVQIERCREHRWLKLHQEGYVMKLLEDEGMLDCKPSSTPIDDGLTKMHRVIGKDVDSTANLIARKRFQGIFGRLMWLAAKTRIDIWFTVQFYSRMLSTAGVTELAWIRNQPLRYLNGTRNYGIVYQAGVNLDMNGSSDSDFAGDLATSRSTAGGHIALGEYGTVIANCRLMKGVKTSTGHAETAACSSWCKEEQALRVQLREFGLKEQGRADCKIDNAGVVKQAINTTNHAEAKHYRVAQAHIRELCDEQEVHLVQTPTDLNPADFFTKALGRASFQRHRLPLMGPQDNPGITKAKEQAQGMKRKRG